MTDVAALNLSVDSSDVVQAANDLDKFSAASKRAGAAAGAPSGSIAKLVAMVQSMDSKLSGLIGNIDKAERHMNTMSKAAQTAAAANDNMASSASKAASALAQSDSHVTAYTQHLAALVAQQRQANAHVLAWERSLTGQASATADSNAHIIAYRNSLGQVEESAKKVSTAIKFTAQDSLNASRQLADIGVTAAMGMSPFMIAIQQGPQLLDILQNKAAVTGQTIGAVFRAAAASVLAFLAPFAPVIAAVATLAAGIAALTARANDDSGLKKFTTAMGYTQKQVEQLNSVTVTYGDTMKAVFQVAWSRIANTFGITTDQLSAKWTAFTDWMVAAIQNGLAGVYAALTGAQNIIPRLIDNIKTGKKESLFEIIGGSYTDQFSQAKKFMSEVVDQARKNAQGRQSSMAEGFRASNAGSPSAGAKAANDNKSDPWGDLLKSAEQQQRALEDAGSRIGKTGFDLDLITAKQTLYNQAIDAGIPIMEKGTIALNAQGLELQRRATIMAETMQDNRVAEFNAALTKSFTDQMAALQQEAGAIGLTGAALEAYRYKVELLNLAKAAGLAQDPEVLKNIRDHAAAYEAAAASNDRARQAIDQQRQAMEFNREVAKGFFTDLVNGVRQGESIFKSFEKAVSNAIDRIIDKMLEMALNQMFGGGSGGMGGGMAGGGLAGGAGAIVGAYLGTQLGKGLVSLFGSLFADGGAFGTTEKYALGGSFGSAQRFASGGAFTNSILNSPTLFKFANGTKLGVAGEAGPEAVMPLKRGPDGKLGVHASGGGGGSGGGNNIKQENNITNHYKIEGGFTPESAVAMIRQGGEQTIQQIRRDLQTMLQQLDMDGTLQ